MNGIHLCERCKYCTHSPNLFQPYYWCSWYGKEVKTPINRCDKITLKKGTDMKKKTVTVLAIEYSKRVCDPQPEFIDRMDVRGLVMSAYRSGYIKAHSEHDMSKKRTMQIDVIEEVKGTQYLQCKLYIDGNASVILMNKIDYERLLSDSFFVRDGKNRDSAGVLNTTNTFLEKD